MSLRMLSIYHDDYHISPFGYSSHSEAYGLCYKGGGGALSSHFGSGNKRKQVVSLKRSKLKRYWFCLLGRHPAGVSGASQSASRSSHRGGIERNFLVDVHEL